VSDETIRILAAVVGVVAMGFFIRALGSMLQGLIDFLRGNRRG
jgi:hypothetical protein